MATDTPLQFTLPENIVYVATASESESGLHPLSTSHTPTTLHDGNTTLDNGDQMSLNAVVPIMNRKHVHIHTRT